MDFTEFKKSIRTSTKGKQFTIRNSYGVYDCYKHIRKNGWFDIGRPVKEHEFYTIIREVSKLLSKNLLTGEKVVFPCLMGQVELRKYKPDAKIVNGKLKVTYPVNWNDTLKLWYEDEEAREKKILLRFEERFIYFIKYNSFCAKYNNKVFYKFSPHVKLKKGLKEYIKNGTTDTLW